jgi:BMFP domain-containing protein YqiC
MSIDTAIETMIESYIDDQDFVSRTDASMEAESYTDQCIGDIQDELGVLMVRLEALEAKTAPAAEDESEEPLDAWLGPKYKEEPRAVNQIDWVMTPNDMIAGYDSSAMLESYVRSCLDNPNQAPMVIAMVLTTARNIINKKLEAES